MSSPVTKQQSDDVAEKVLRRVEIAKASEIDRLFFIFRNPAVWLQPANVLDDRWAVFSRVA
jgi:hypothetical protein